MERRDISRHVGTMIAAACIILIAGCKPDLRSYTPPPAPLLSLADADPNIRLVRAAAADRADLVQKALAEGASANFSTSTELIFAPGRHTSGGTWLAAICIQDAAEVNADAVARVLLNAGADPNACGGRSLIGPHDGYNGIASKELGSMFIQHGYMPSAREVAYFDRLASAAPTMVNPSPDVIDKVALASVVLSAGGAAIQAEIEQKRAAEGQTQVALQGARDSYARVGRGSTVCSRHGAYRQDYLGYVEDRDGDRVQIRVAGSKSGLMAELKSQDIIWDSILTWTPCEVARR